MALIGVTVYVDRHSFGESLAFTLTTNFISLFRKMNTLTKG